MIAKIVSGHGTDSAGPAMRYVAGKENHKGIERDEVIHLFGDDQQLIDLTESLTCKHTYLSSALSFTNSMNHLQALKAFNQQSKQASDDVKTIIDDNMKQLRQDLQRQTKCALAVF